MYLSLERASFCSMHARLDVNGGCVLATSLSPANLNDPANSELKQPTYEEVDNI
ncbi:hypothetical protein MKY66_06130 [Paenibacillus sp. FSL R5-0766]|uniref:hypothetical protein n=1 Tax=Paenibacillus sp. FSL R5-0766 TaxID=2921658 RepID=UPI0030D70CF1